GDEEPFDGFDDGDAVEDEADSGNDSQEGNPFDPARGERHPLQERAMAVLKRLDEIFRNLEAGPELSGGTLFQGAGDMMGGLAQALSRHEDDDADDPDAYGLRVTQLKRALRGAAFARGALFPLRPALGAEPFKELWGTLGQMEQDIFQEL